MKASIKIALLWVFTLLISNETIAQGSQKMYTWGTNDFGQLGLGEIHSRNTPHKIGSAANWKMIAAGKSHNLAINDNGELYSFGKDDYGQLGLGSNGYHQHKPVRIGSNNNWEIIAAGEYHSLAINSNGELYSWGRNDYGQLGLGSTNQFNTPQRVGNLSNWKYVAAGANQSYLIDSNGHLYSCGYNYEGQLGLGNTTDFSTPQLVDSTRNWISIQSGYSHSIGLSDSGEIYSWGANNNGSLGLGIYNYVIQKTPKKIGNSNNWVLISSGSWHSLAINSNGELFAWGSPGMGETGLGYTATTPAMVGSDTNWLSVHGGEQFTIALKSNGEIYSFGKNDYGQLGLGNNQHFSSPQQIGTSTDWIFASSGSYHSIIINSQQELYAFGSNEYGQLGIGNTNAILSPRSLTEKTNWQSISSRSLHSAAINLDGELFVWGFGETSPKQIGKSEKWHIVSTGFQDFVAINKKGELFNWGTHNNNPAKVGTDSNWINTVSGEGTCLAINNIGELYSWTSGNNNLQKIDTAFKWTSIAAGSGHFLAINSKGKLYSWGGEFNNLGQLGQGSSATSTNTPKQIGNDSNWINVSADIYHSFALNSKGELFSWGGNWYGMLGLGFNSWKVTTPSKVGSDSNWISVSATTFGGVAINSNSELYSWGYNDYGALGIGNTTNQNSPQRVGLNNRWSAITGGDRHTLALARVNFIWNGVNEFTSNSCWSDSLLPGQYDSAKILSGTMTVNQATTLDAMKVNNSATVKLTAPLTVRNLHLNNGTIDLNGQRLTITGGIYQSTDSTNYYIQAGTPASPKPLSELVFAPTANTSSTLYFNPNANTLKVLELGTSSKNTTITLGNALKIKGGTKTDIGSLKINNGSKIIIPSGASLTLACDTFNSYLNLSHPAQRAIHCQGTGTFNLERQHYGARGWRLYSHPFSSDINLTQIADDIELIGSGGTAEGFYSDAYTNNSTFWYDYSKADTTATTDLAWTGFSSAKGTVISGNPNKWKKHAPIIVFNPGAVRGSGAFSDPSAATYQQGKITLSYSLDSTAVHLNDGKTQTISTADLTSAPKSRYFFLTNPFTAPVRLARIQGLNLTNCANKFYYWKQNHASISGNFMPAAWASEALFNGNATRDSNISIPAFGTILIEMKNPSTATTFTIPESAKQLSNFDYLVGGDLSSSGSGVKQTLFMEIPQTYQGPGAIEVQLLMNDSVPVDRMLIYDRIGESSSFTNNDAKKFKEPSFANIYSLAKGGELLSLDAQDITTRLNSGEPSVEIPLVIERDFNKSQGNFRLRIWEKHSELQCFFKDAKTGQEYPAESFDDLPIAFEADETVLNRYSLVFKRKSSSTEDFPQEKEALASQSKMELIVFPNPGNDYIHIRVTHNTQILPYALYTSDGRVVNTGHIKNFKTLDIKSLSKGIYYLICNGETTKFIKQQNL